MPYQRNCITQRAPAWPLGRTPGGREQAPFTAPSAAAAAAAAAAAFRAAHLPNGRHRHLLSRPSAAGADSASPSSRPARRPLAVIVNDCRCGAGRAGSGGAKNE